MVEKMKYVNIMGAIDDIDRVIEKYVSKYDIQLEYASGELLDVNGLYHFSGSNPYLEPEKKVKNLLKFIDINDNIYTEVSYPQALRIIDQASHYYAELNHSIAELEEKRKNLQQFTTMLQPLLPLNIDFDVFSNFRFISYHFGRIPYHNYRQFEAFVYTDENILFVESQKYDEYMYGIYFVPLGGHERVESMLSSFHFDMIWVPYELEGKPLHGSFSKVYADIENQIAQLDEQIIQLHRHEISGEDFTIGKLAGACHKVMEMSFYYDTRKYATKTEKNFYIFTGWMSEYNTKKLRNELNFDPEVLFVCNDEAEQTLAHPPSTLKNIPPFKPFEFFVKMYGIPRHNEIDPTWLIALTYTLFFGLMFGDVGHGLVMA